MGFVIVFEPAIDQVPAGVRTSLRDRLLDVASVLETIAPGSVVMDSMEQSPMQLQVEGWRFRYNVDRRNQRLRVTEAIGPDQKH